MFGDKERKKARYIFANIADIGSLFLAFIYVFYAVVLLLLNIGNRALSYAMLGITIAYVIFFFIKIFYLNKINPTTKVKRITKLTYKYTKFAMKLINAAFVAISLINIRFSENSVIALIGIIIVVASFAISFIWDLSMFAVKRKFRELKSVWAGYSDKEKKAKVQFLINSFVSSLDNITGLDKYVEVAVDAGKLVGEKLKEEKLKEKS